MVIAIVVVVIDAVVSSTFVVNSSDIEVDWSVAGAFVVVSSNADPSVVIRSDVSSAVVVDVVVVVGGAKAEIYNIIY